MSAKTLHQSGIILSLFSVLLLCACSSSVTVQGDFPSPLVDQRDINMGVYTSEKYANFSYTEKSKDRSKWTINTGMAQQKLFNTVFSAMFRQITPVASLPTVGQYAAVDLIIASNVKEFQYAMPRETKVNIFEVWIKYNVQVYDNRGALVADWVMPAYGKTPTAFLKSEEEALNQAIIIALRDAGANFIQKFERLPEIQVLLAQPRMAPPAANNIAKPKLKPAPQINATRGAHYSGRKTIKSKPKARGQTPKKANEQTPEQANEQTANQTSEPTPAASETQQSTTPVAPIATPVQLDEEDEDAQ